MPVERGDTIYIPASKLGEKELRPQWSQGFRTREETYIVAEYHNKTRAGESENRGAIFIQKNKLDELKRKSTGGEDLTVVVDDSFQYGQKKGGTNRFLVFHDKDHKLYQHRFVQSIFIQFGRAGADVASELGFGEVGHSVDDVASRFIGDYLHNY